MKTVIIIPARYASTRYPGKPLVELTLPDGSRQSLIELSWRAAKRVSGVDAILSPPMMIVSQMRRGALARMSS